MEYKHVTYKRKIKYGPDQICKNYDEAEENVRRLRGDVLRDLSLDGFYKAIETMEEIQEDNAITLKITIKYPINIL